MQSTSFDAAVASVPILPVKISLRIRLALLFPPVLLATVTAVPLSLPLRQFTLEVFG